MPQAVSAVTAATPFALRAWVDRAPVGEWCTYHIGRWPNNEASKLARDLCFKEGLVTLACKRVGVGLEFMARRVPNPGTRR